MTLRIVHVVLRESPSALAFSSSPRYPSAMSASPICLILADWRAFMIRNADRLPHLASTLAHRDTPGPAIAIDCHNANRRARFL